MDSGGFFKSLTSTFKSHSNGDRQKISAETVTDDLMKRELFEELQTGSTSTRARAAGQIAESLYDFYPQSIPDVWYCAKDLIAPGQQQSTRKAGLALLTKCVSSPSDDPNSQYVYFTDALMNCQFAKGKCDPELQSFVQILKIMTDNGTFIHHFQESLKQPLLDFFTSALSTNDLVKSPTVLELLQFLIESIKSGIFNIDQPEAVVGYVSKILSLIIKLSLKTSDRVILEYCIQTLDAVALYQTVPQSLLYETLEILCGACILDLHYYDMVTSVVTNLINRVQSSLVISTLVKIVLCHNSRNDKNINASIGAMKVIGYLFPNFAYQFDITSLLSALEEIVGWNKQNLLIVTLQFFNDVLLSDITLNQIPAHNWDGENHSILNLLSVISSKLSKDQEIDLFKITLITLQNLGETTRYPGNLKNLVTFFLRHPKHLSTKACIDVLRYYGIHNLCSPLNENWKGNLELLLNTFYYDESKDVTVRKACVKLLDENFDSALDLVQNGDDTVLFEISDYIFDGLLFETSSEVVQQYLSHHLQSALTLPSELFEKITERYFLPRLCAATPRERRSSLTSSFSSLRLDRSDVKPFPEQTTLAIVKNFVTLFAKTLSTQAKKAQFIFNLLINVLKHALQTKNVDLMLTTSRLFVRIRASTKKQVYLTNPTDMDGLSAAFSRNLNLRKTSDATGSVSLDEKWVYPEEISFIPHDTLDQPSKELTIMDYNSDKLVTTPTIDIQLWLSIVIQILEIAPDWEIYSFIYSHFCPQLSNITLFESCGDGIRKFRSLVCDQLTLKLPSGLSIPDHTTKQDVQVAIVRNFTALISYSALFSKQDEDQIINALLFGLSSWEKTAIPCVHILTICCYELPMSVKKFLSVILTKLQTRISSAFASAHILEFLLALSYIPSLTSNFTVDEFKRAFGITFKLIQYAHDISEVKDNEHHGILTHGEELEAELLPSTENFEVTPVISIYLLSLSYDVIANWFLNMRLSDRRQLSSFIIKNLILSQSNRGSEINNQNMSFIDLISRFTYSDLELSFSPIKPQGFASEDPVLSSKWVYGNSIITIDTHAKTGESIVAVRRASGFSVFRITPDESMIPFYTNQLHSKTDGEDLFSANYMLLQLVVHPETSRSIKPIPIPDDSQFTRSLNNFDRIPVVEFHKVGLLYIGPGQSTEQEILGNSKGSAEFDRFLASIGRPITLKGCKSFYVGGLDTENDVDGPIAYGWNDKILQLILHTTTLMPTPDDSDPGFSAKKRHIGNNYVNIFFDESCHPFQFNVIKSQFNFLNILIQPHSVTFGTKDEAGSQDKGIKKYKVKIHRRSGVPGLFATCHFKIISEENLPIFVRSLALIANQFAHVWHSNGSYASNWSHRMNQLQMIRERSIKAHEELKTSAQQDTSKDAHTTMSIFDQLNNKGSTSGNRVVSNGRGPSVNSYEFTEDDDNEILKNLEFTSFTK
ncbi:uncharacterized protein CYBJADRAFT_162854 [Cyberlindnera jadinii NRRL Y-1542]|uniref:Rap-GAP domain-containing protein n=1 Tax=Cyberlindnera jadinii (strain ATCC 18201 / CBS 1600 / BCRC 20928 / JCM 3617 / NBRC 0987 / NRRL Y-1542) TaxID=983966 RepID=A0A1E4S0E4_CYBJN|nr:hypothetical protein CYBJADRAFT_162854 [Cyberlindnera jadinii NRRL Y-1542]ODV72960.1 hypothetical protein CYBJADRAFT_162854 [Cyberlindnera jadinii NRRL Y-1542]